MIGLNNLKKKHSLALALVAAAGFSLASQVDNAAIADGPQIIKISAKKFTFIPNKFTVKKNVPVVLQITTLDRSHGFCLPAFNARTDVDPGKPSELKFTPNKSGDFVFYCDVECGDGHDNMEGKMQVVD